MLLAEGRSAHGLANYALLLMNRLQSCLEVYNLATTLRDIAHSPWQSPSH